MPQIDFRAITLEEVVDGLESHGYLGVRADLSWTFDHDALKYLGWGSDRHRWIMGYQDGHGRFCVCWLFLELKQSGLEFDYGTDIFESEVAEEVLEFIERKCN